MYCFKLVKNQNDNSLWVFISRNVLNKVVGACIGIYELSLNTSENIKKWSSCLVLHVVHITLTGITTILDSQRRYQKFITVK